MSTYPNITDGNPNNIGPRGFYYILDKLKKYLLGEKVWIETMFLNN